MDTLRDESFEVVSLIKATAVDRDRQQFSNFIRVDYEWDELWLINECVNGVVL